MKTLGLALVLAVLGFSYALATRSDREEAAPRSVSPRAGHPRSVGQDLKFTNAFIGSNVDPAYPTGGGASPSDPQGFDLGDGVLGQPVTRYLTAAGGFLPYTFETKANFDFIGPQDTPPVPKLVLHGNGKILDTFGSAINGAARFNATVTDFLGTQRTGTFRLNLFAPPTKFRFAQDKLPVAQLGNSYFANIETLSAPGTVLYVVFGPITGVTRLDGKPITQLGDIGLWLAADGVLYGRPSFAAVANSTASQTITFTVRAVTASGAIAFSRNGLVQDQKFSLEVEPNTQANSEVLATQCSIRANVPHTNTNPFDIDTDSLTYSGVFDPKGMTTSSLAGSPFSLRVNFNTYAGTFDANGKVDVAFPGKNKGLKVSVNPTAGLINIKLTGAGIPYLPPNNQSSGKLTVPAVFCMEFKHYRTCDALFMAGRVANGRIAVNYALTHASDTSGPMGANTTVDRSFAGGFQILSVTGADAKKFDGTKGDPGIDGDKWFVRFIGVPRYGIDSGAKTALPVRDKSEGNKQTGSVNATMRIGDDFTQDVTAKIISDRLRFKAKLSDDGIYDLAIDGTHFFHTLQTNVLVEDDTIIPQAIKVKKPTIFKLGMDVTGFSGENGRIISPNGFIWQSR